MANKPMWDWMDKAEGRKDSSFDAANKERKRQGYGPMQSGAKKLREKLKRKNNWGNWDAEHKK